MKKINFYSFVSVIFIIVYFVIALYNFFSESDSFYVILIGIVAVILAIINLASFFASLHINESRKDFWIWVTLIIISIMPLIFYLFSSIF